MSQRSYQAIQYTGFAGGLNLRDGPDTVNPAQAIDALNVRFTERGAINQRAGFAKLSETPLTNRVDSLSAFYKTDGTQQLLAGCGTRLEGLTTGGVVIDSETGLAGGPWSFARVGTPNSELAYAGNGTDTLRKWDGATWTAPTATVDGVAAQAMPKAGLLAVDSTDNRLVATGFATTTGGPGGATSSPSHVYFSDPGQPEVWGSNNFEQLRPGDGEKIMGVAAWREYIFVFKETAFWVFYSTTPDADGEPIFNFRPVDAGVGLASSRAIAVHHDGVYFLSRNGVYRTTGQTPQKVSDLIDPIFLGGAAPFYTGGILKQGSITNCAMTVWQDRVYLAYTSDTATVNDRVLVYDPQIGWWTLYNFHASALCAFRVSTDPDLLFGYSDSTNSIGRHNSTYTNDAGVAISSHWASGWFDYGLFQEKTIRESKIWGSGDCTLGIGTDFEVGASTIGPLAFDTEVLVWDVGFWGDGVWGPSSSINSLLSRGTAVRGEVFSTQFTNNVLDSTFSIHRFAHHLRGRRRASVVHLDH